MSSENGDQVLLESRDETKNSKKKYMKEFLLSFKDLDICKKLPSSFDVSLLSLFEDAFNSTSERQRYVGSEYGMLSQSRPESLGGYSRGSQGRWDTRSSGSSDKEGELQSNREAILPDSGRRFGNQTRRNWQSSEHDGLLGSGAFPRPTGYIGSSAPKGRGNGHYQLSKSTEPYQPPRPYKAVPYSKKDTDSHNDETFGSAECSSENRVEEERKRRASFELMRKEQQKVLQGKNKVNLVNHKENIDADVIALIGNSVEHVIGSGSKADESAAISSHGDSIGSSLHIQAPASRPLVPPGFAGPLVEKNLSLQSSSNAFSVEAGCSLLEDKHSLTSVESNQEKGNNLPTPVHANLDALKVACHLSIDSKEKLMLPVSNAEKVKQAIDFENLSSKITLPEVDEVWADDIIIMNDSSCKKGSSGLVNSVSQNSSIILEKLFSSASSKNFTSTPISAEHLNFKADEEKWNPDVSESSKFARWFSEEERKSGEDPSSRELLSLIVSNEKASSQVSTSNREVTENMPLSSNFECINTPPMLHSSPATSNVILTCEEIEQSILAEVKGSSASVNGSIQGTWTPSTSNKSEKQKAYVDDQASQHLLSLLQKGTSMKESSPSPSSSHHRPQFIESSEKFSISDLLVSDDTGKNSEEVHSSEKTLTLETLFGSSFMNALHSAQAPISAQRGSNSHESGPNMVIHEGDMGALNLAPHDHIDVNIEGKRAGEIQLPEEDSLITVGDTLNSLNSETFQFKNPYKPGFLPENSAVDLNNEFRAMLREEEERLKRVPNSPGQLHKGAPLEMVDPNSFYHHLHGRSQFPPHQIDQARPLFPPLDHLSHRNPHHSFPGNIIPHQGYNSVSAPRFDPATGAAAHHPLLQDVQILGNFPHHHSVPGLPRGGPISHPINHMPGYVPEMNNMRNFPMHGRQPSYGGGHGMGLPGPVVGGGGATHPEALERLFEMEMRAANSKQIHPPSMGAHIPGFYDHPPIDMNIRYR